jgi:flagellin
MALTVTNTNTMTLLNILNKNTQLQSNTLKQLSTGKRINAGKDDPAGLIALSTLDAELTAVNATLVNNQRTDAMLAVADGSIGEISTMLSQIESIIAATASKTNITDAEIAANQSQIDNALAAIDRIVSTTNFNGKRLLDGSMAIDVSGAAGNQYMNNLRVFSRSQETTDTSVTVSRVASATVASAAFAFAGGAARTSGTTNVVIKGALGTATVTLASGLTQAQIVAAVNGVKAQTGVSAIQNATNIKLNSNQYGQDAFVSVEVLSGGKINSNYGIATSDNSTGNDLLNTTKQAGRDIGVTINGQSASSDGLDVFFSNNTGLNVQFTVSEDFGKGNTGAVTSTSFTVKASGGATFQLGTTASTRQTIGIDAMGTFNLGGGNGSAKLSELKSGATKALKNDTAGALTAVREAITDVVNIRGRIGGFQKYQVGSSINSLTAAQTGLNQAISAIGDTDYALATTNLNRETVLVQSGIQLLGLANQQSSQILSLLGI